MTREGVCRYTLMLSPHLWRRDADGAKRRDLAFSRLSPSLRLGEYSDPHPVPHSNAPCYTSYPSLLYIYLDQALNGVECSVYRVPLQSHGLRRF
ncbi:hypothetical protein M404DRAFT_174955 [Pisolithus tinctorius Marx 270]|uniref:Uncharacterized protein n=1 Tax=Pisolithus tinctorius Marx 270 TaxID=870435 RepID=A0A0C3KY79_PISTI|nr:hypothetical protein M404DRAFT_174955 [Pisolithus tinctorius Marx 270]